MAEAAKKTKKEDIQAVAVATEAQAPAVRQPVDLAAWGVQQLTSKDIIIPKILAMQGLSKFVTDGKAMMGEFRDSLNGGLLGDYEKNPLEFIPFYLEKVWAIYEEKNGEMKFSRTVPIEPGNENWPIEEVLNGVKIKRDRTANFYVLLPSDIKKGEAIPHILSFRRTSARAGQKLNTTMFMKNLKAGKTPASMVMELFGAKVKNDKGVFIVLDVREKRESEAGEVAEAFSWVAHVKSGAAKVDNSDLEGEAPNLAPPTGQAQF